MSNTGPVKRLLFTSILPPALSADEAMITAAGVGETEIYATDRRRASPMAIGITV
jgi:hypothetical protein